MSTCAPSSLRVLVLPQPTARVQLEYHPYPLVNALEGGDTPCTEAFPVHYRCLTCSIFCLSSPQFYCMSSQ